MRYLSPALGIACTAMAFTMAFGDPATVSATDTHPPAPADSEVYTKSEIQSILAAQAAQATKECQNARSKLDDTIANAVPVLAKLSAQLNSHPPAPAVPSSSPMAPDGTRPEPSSQPPTP
jgi:hypothetical protein